MCVKVNNNGKDVEFRLFIFGILIVILSENIGKKIHLQAIRNVVSSTKIHCCTLIPKSREA